MTYRIVGVDEFDIVIQFRKNNEEILFESYQKAEDYLDYIHQQKVIPSQYELVIKN